MMTASPILQRSVVMALCLCMGGCASTVRQSGRASMRLSLSLLSPEDYETLETVEGYGSRILVCGIPFGDGEYAYVNCPLNANMPPEAKRRPDVFAQNPIVADVGKAGGIFVAGAILSPFWLLFLEYKPSPPRDATASAVFHALQKQPQADTFLPQTVIVWRAGVWPIYQKEWARVEGKAIRIKNDKERFGG